MANNSFTLHADNHFAPELVLQVTFSPFLLITYFVLAMKGNFPRMLEEKLFISKNLMKNLVAFLSFRSRNNFGSAQYPVPKIH